MPKCITIETIRYSTPVSTASKHCSGKHPTKNGKPARRSLSASTYLPSSFPSPPRESTTVLKELIIALQFPKLLTVESVLKCQASPAFQQFSEFEGRGFELNGGAFTAFTGPGQDHRGSMNIGAKAVMYVGKLRHNAVRQHPPTGGRNRIRAAEKNKVKRLAIRESNARGLVIQLPDLAGQSFSGAMRANHKIMVHSAGNPLRRELLLWTMKPENRLVSQHHSMISTLRCPCTCMAAAENRTDGFGCAPLPTDHTGSRSACGFCGSRVPHPRFLAAVTPMNLRFFRQILHRQPCLLHHQ